ncbi:MAG: ATP-binding protein, partial [Clostridia bacterium]|nr:ATP-binding protein [Clostridia bacterium]
IIEMSLDVRDNKAYRDPDAFNEYAKAQIADAEMHYFLLDEVQLMDDFESVLIGLMQRRNVDVYVTGSNARFLSRDVITEFSGRGDEIHMGPLSFGEFMTVYPGDRRDGFDEYVLYGGLPPVVLIQEEVEKIAFLNRLFAETYIRDIIQRHKIRNQSEMEELLNILSSNIGGLTNPEKLKNTFRTVKKSKITAATIAKYLSYLENSYLIESAQRYDIKGKSYIETPLKFYFTDLGLRNARINFRQVEITHSMENIIYNELRMRQFNVDVGVVTVSERGKSGVPVRKQLEVDFVCNQGSKRYYVQSAYALPDEEKRQQELRPFRKIKDSFKKIVITGDTPRPLYNDEGILMMNIYDFLLNPDSLDI